MINGIQNRILDFLNKFSTLVGIDKSIFYTSIARIIQGFGGIITVFFIARYLTEIEQGFYFTFASILAIQIFFELGLNGIITQYVAHEVSHLKLIDYSFIGEKKYLSRLASLLQFCIKWYILVAIVFLFVIFIVGYVFFSHFYEAQEAVNWILPWLLISISTTFSLFISPFLAFLQGLGMVKQVAKLRLMQQLIIMAVAWMGLTIGLKLYVGGISTLFGVAILLYFTFTKFMPIFRNLYKITIIDKVSYKKEIFPYQWKIALSWISGYFIFQLFNPVLFATEGAVIAGQMGMTLAVLNAVLGFTLSWVNTKVPLFSGLIALKQFKKLDFIFNKTLLQSSIINVLGLIVIFIAISSIRNFQITIADINFSDRFLPHLPLFLMMVAILLNHFISAWATYLRCHKKEPMLVQSLTIGLLSCISTIVLGKKFGVIGLTSGYVVLTIIGFIWTYKIFNSKKKLWHYE